jgi:hypothetical protein
MRRWNEGRHKLDVPMMFYGQKNDNISGDVTEEE